MKKEIGSGGGPGGRTCLLYFAHKLEPTVLAGWDHLKATYPAEGFEPCLLYDNSRGDFAEGPNLSRGEAFLFTFAEIAERFPVVIYDQAQVDVGNVHFPILKFFFDRPGYDYVWKIEYDVFLDGDWAAFLTAFEGNDADLLTTTLARPKVRPDWGWWGSLRKPWYDLRPMRKVRSFLPIARFSAKACRVLDKAFRQGWAGHDEVSVPSVLLSKGLRIEDLGGSGEFVASGNVDRVYTNTPTARGLAPGSFVCPPQVPSVQAERGKLYHPVKDRARWLEELDGARRQEL